MIIRRMYYNLMLLKDISNDELKSMLTEIVTFVNELTRPLKIEDVVKSLMDEILTFKNTISRGLKVLDEKLKNLS
jgi:alanyl-tRNA synthetase